MGRTTRNPAAGQVLHVTAHAIPDRLCFPDGAARMRFLQLALRACAREPCSIHAYAMMDNHLHMLLSGEMEGSPGRMLKVLLANHAVALNRAEGRGGPCWRGRYSCIAIQSELHLVRSHLYIEANPWRAGLVEHPALSTWTSFHFNGLGCPDELLTPHEVMLGLAGPSKDWRAEYRRLMDEYIQTSVRYKSPLGKPLYSDPLAGLHVFGVDVR
jgi:putative transposase